MTRGPIIHGVLLVAALLFAYQTWTREEKVEPTTGKVVLWSVPAASITEATYHIDAEEERTVRIERRSDEHGSYLWGWETRAVIETTKRKDAAATVNEAGATIRPVDTAKVSNTREFAVGKKGAESIEKLAEMRALRDLGVVTEEQKARYDLQEGAEKITMVHAGGSRSLILGGQVFGGADRYALDPDSGRAYVLSNELISDLIAGETTLRLLVLHRYEQEDVKKSMVEVGDQKRTLVRIQVPDEAGNKHESWAEADKPDKPDQTMANFLQSVDRLRPAIYESERTPEEMKRVVRVEYQGAGGGPLGWVELYERPPQQAPDVMEEDGEAAAAAQAGAAGEKKPSYTPAPKTFPKSAEPMAEDIRAREQRKLTKKDVRPTYYMRTELTRVMAVVPYNQATRITEDIGQIFGQ